VTTLRQKKARLKEQIGASPAFASGSCPTLTASARRSAPSSSTIPDARRGSPSGWGRRPSTAVAGTCTRTWSTSTAGSLSTAARRQEAYPRTDDILARAINLSVGVVDAGLGAAFGINVRSTDDEIDRAAETFRQACA